MRNDTLIVEDLLLMMFDDRSGTIAGEGTLFYALGGAVLVELGLGGYVEVDGKQGLAGAKVRALTGKQPSDPLLRTAHEKIAERERGVQSLLITIGGDLRKPVLERLVERGMLRQESRRTLGVFRTTATTAADTSHKEAVTARVRAALVDGEEPDDRTAAVAGLLSASGTLPTLHRTIPWSGQVYRRAKELEQRSWGAEAVNAAVLRTVAAVSTSVVVTATT